MKPRLIKRKSCDDFADHHPGSRTPLEEFISNFKGANWNHPNDIKQTFNSADILGKGTNRVIF